MSSFGDLEDDDLVDTDEVDPAAVAFHYWEHLNTFNAGAPLWSELPEEHRVALVASVEEALTRSRSGSRSTVPAPEAFWNTFEADLPDEPSWDALHPSAQFLVADAVNNMLVWSYRQGSI